MKQHYGDESEEGEDSGVKGYMDLITFLDKVRESTLCTAAQRGQRVHRLHHLPGQGERVRCVQQRSGDKGYMNLITFLDKVREYVVCSSGVKRYMDLITFQDKERVRCVRRRCEHVFV